jgi:RNA polymerase sigma-70 factor (ECF subfamily)
MFRRVAVPVDGSAAQRVHAIPIETEDEAVERARRGEVRAWDLVVRHHQETVFRVACLLNGDPVAAGDTTRTTFLRGYRALPELPPGTAIRPWLIGIASGIARSQRRSTDRWFERDTRPFPASGAAPLAADDPGWSLVASLPPDVRDELRSAFELLTWSERLAIAARYLVGATRSEAAKLIGIEPAGVERALEGALRHLRSAITDRILITLPPDRLGWLATMAIVGHFTAAPNVAPEVTDRLERDAITYPEQFGPSRRVASFGG